LYPIADAAYTINIPYAQALTKWSFGTEKATTTTIAIPEDIAHEAVWWGARGALLYGAPGHPDDQAAMREFNDLVKEVQTDVYPVSVWVPQRRASSPYHVGTFI
jgi:hypothetical protein